MWLTNLRNHRRISLPADGDLDTRVTKDSNSLVGKGRGANFYFGRGRRGVVWANGIQVISIRNFRHREHAVVRVRRFEASHVDLCARVGARPVRGREPPRPPVPVHYHSCVQMHRDYTSGVGRPGATDRVRPGDAPVTTFTVDARVYRVNRDLDADHDGIACEKA
jgi:hypothetical protein